MKQARTGGGGRELAEGVMAAVLWGHVSRRPRLHTSGHVPSEFSQPAMEARPPGNRGGGGGGGYWVSASFPQRL